jgi:hypothetical protein
MPKHICQKYWSCPYFGLAIWVSNQSGPWNIALPHDTPTPQGLIARLLDKWIFKAHQAFNHANRHGITHATVEDWKAADDTLTLGPILAPAIFYRSGSAHTSHWYYTNTTAKSPIQNISNRTDEISPAYRSRTGPCGWQAQIICKEGGAPTQCWAGSGCAEK